MVLKYDGPVVLVVMDGVGLNPYNEGNAFTQAHTKNLDKLMAERPWVSLGAAEQLCRIT